MHDEGIKTSTIYNKTNQSNKSEATEGNYTKRKSDTLLKAKKTKNQKIMVSLIHKPNKKAGKGIEENMSQNKKVDEDIKLNE